MVRLLGRSVRQANRSHADESAGEAPCLKCALRANADRPYGIVHGIGRRVLNLPDRMGYPRKFGMPFFIVDFTSKNWQNTEDHAPSGDGVNDNMANKLKQILEKGKPAIGTWLGCSDPYFVEMMADLGFDWLLIDMEHIPISQEGLRTMLMACKGSDSAILVRVSLNSRNYIQAALDLGAHGVMVPMVNSRTDAERAVEFTRYPPIGRRGLGPVRAATSDALALPFSAVPGASAGQADPSALRSPSPHAAPDRRRAIRRLGPAIRRLRASQQSWYGLLNARPHCIFIHRHPWGERPDLPRR